MGGEICSTEECTPTVLNTEAGMVVTSRTTLAEAADERTYVDGELPLLTFTITRATTMKTVSVMAPHPNIEPIDLFPRVGWARIPWLFAPPLWRGPDRRCARFEIACDFPPARAPGLPLLIGLVPCVRGRFGPPDFPPPSAGLLGWPGWVTGRAELERLFSFITPELCVGPPAQPNASPATVGSRLAVGTSDGCGSTQNT